MSGTKLQERALLMLNSLLEIDQKAVQEVIDNRVPIASCVLDSDNPGVVGSRNGATTLGALGLINGLLGSKDLIAAAYDDDGVLVEFAKHK